MKLKTAATFLALLIAAAGSSAPMSYHATVTGIDTVYPGFVSVVAGGASLQLIRKDFAFTEGPASDKTGNIFFTDQPNNRIWKYDLEGKLSLFLEPSGRSNGLAFDKNGSIISCADENDQLWSIDKSGKHNVLIKDYQGHRLNGPNDVWIHPSGNIYVTDPFYPRDYWDRKSPDLPSENVYVLLKGKQELELAAGSLQKPNGVTGTPDGRYLYVADIKASKTYRYEIAKDGSLKNKMLFVSQGSDGMTLDKEGNLYLTGNGITVYDRKGQKREHIDVPSKWTANLCFGGKDRSLLFITASEAIYTLQMKVKGVEEGYR